MRRRQPKNSRTRSATGGGRGRLWLFLCVLLFGALSGGFIAFASHVDRLNVPQTLTKADGIVVWTGSGAGRLEMAGRLLQDARGERVLVSGVNTQLDQDRVAALLNVSEDLALCCLDIDYAALDTRGNARETAIWAETLDYQHILLVTSSYHMPRARLEIGHESPDLKITAVPVRSGPDQPWWQDRPRVQRLLGEYGKYLLAMARGRSDRESLREPVLPEAGLTETEAD